MIDSLNYPYIDIENLFVELENQKKHNDKNITIIERKILELMTNQNVENIGTLMKIDVLIHRFGRIKKNPDDTMQTKIKNLENIIRHFYEITS